MAEPTFTDLLSLCALHHIKLLHCERRYEERRVRGSLRPRAQEKGTGLLL